MTWTTTRLKYLCVDAGQYGLNISAQDYAASGHRLIRTSDIDEFGRLRSREGAVYVDVRLDARHEVRKGDLLLSRSGTIGRTMLLDALEEPSTYAGYLVRFRPRPSTEPRFMAYVAASNGFQAAIKADAVTSTIQNFNAERYANIAVMLPPPDEQRRIADFLDAETARIDILLDKSGRQKELIEARFRAMARVATTGVTGNSVSTHLEWMPFINGEWTLRKISREFKASSGTTPNSENEQYYNGPFPWVNSADLEDGVIDHVERSVTQVALDDYQALKIQPAGALVVAMYGQGDTKGRVGLLAAPACLNQACCALIPTGRIMSEFAAYWFRAHKDGIISLAVGAGQPNLSQELIRRLMIPAPEREEQERIVRFLRSEEAHCKAQSALLDGRCKLLVERRQALITAAVTGQIDVTTARGKPFDGGLAV